MRLGLQLESSVIVNNMFSSKSTPLLCRFSLTVILSLVVSPTLTLSAPVAQGVVRAAVPAGAIQHVLLINLENKNFNDTFGPHSPAVYLNNSLLKQGQLLVNYFATSHLSLGNYIAEVSGQGANPSLNNDCMLSSSSTQGSFIEVLPGDKIVFPGQVVGNGCVFPAKTQTIADQVYAWRAYMEDMGNDPQRDYGTPDKLGGTDCAHPLVGGTDHTVNASPTDQYATRHNPFVYFHSVIDDQQRCNTHVVPLGKVVVGVNGSKDEFSGHLYEDLRHLKTTPQFMLVSPNLCNDGHDAICVGHNVEGTHQGGLFAADVWLKHWMPMILNSPAYQSGKMLVVLTFDEANLVSPLDDSRACEKTNQADCHSPTGPNISNPGYSPLMNSLGLQASPEAGILMYPGGGQVGAVLFNKRFIKAGSINRTGSYNHFSALRSYEDILGITQGGDDGYGHLGYAGAVGMLPFGKDVFNHKG